MNTVDTVVLLHSPLTSATAWGRWPTVLREAGLDVVVPEVLDDDVPPYAGRYVGRVAVQLREVLGTKPCLLVAHSGAGPLVPQVGFARHAAGARVTGYVLLDAMLPRALRAATRLELMRVDDEPFAVELESALRRGERFPDWSDGDLREVIPDDSDRTLLLAGLRPRTLDFFTEPLPLHEDWPDAPVGYIRLSDPYDPSVRTARQRGWPVVVRESNHFAAVTDPGLVSAALFELFDHLFAETATPH
ncbi:MAG: alpha/beta hydrolase [Actinomycetes bacterium]